VKNQSDGPMDDSDIIQIFRRLERLEEKVDNLGIAVNQMYGSLSTFKFMLGIGMTIVTVVVAVIQLML